MRPVTTGRVAVLGIADAGQNRRMTPSDTVPGALPNVPAHTSLDDFQPLRRAERILLRACTHGDIAKVGLRRPVAATVDVTVRASLLAFLARGGGPDVRVRARRIEMLGAWVEGRLDLGDARVAMSLWFYRCVFDTTPMLDNANVQGGVGFPDCSLPGLMAEGCRITLDLALNAGCSIAGEIRLKRAQIAGDLHCARLKLQTGDDTASTKRPFVADAARIDGDVILSEGFESVGEVRFVGAHVGGDFLAGHARLTGPIDTNGARSAALVLDRIHVDGSVHLDAGFAAAGRVCLRRARIGGDLDCTAAAFDMVGDAAWGNGVALVLDRARIRGTLFLRRLQGPLLGASLADTRVKVLADDATAWGERIVLDGFAYSRFGEGAPIDAPFRLAWLERQEPAHLADDFRNHPWRRLIGVLRGMGHAGGATQVAMRREAVLRRIGRIGESMPRPWRWLARGVHSGFGLLAGYGHRPQRLVGWAVAVWLACAAVFWFAAEEGVMAPADPAVFGDPRLATCRTRTANWTECAALPREHPRFHALAYSADLLLPFANLQQSAAWHPAVTAPPAGTPWAVGLDDGVRALAWFETLFGWLAGLTLIASLAGWADRDRRLP
jgi:hypothetical protein